MKIRYIISRSFSRFPMQFRLDQLMYFDWPDMRGKLVLAGTGAAPKPGYVIPYRKEKM